MEHSNKTPIKGASRIPRASKFTLTPDEKQSLREKNVNELNKRTLLSNNSVEFNYRYFTTVLYVCFAYVLGLTKEFENASILKNFLLENSINN